MNIHVVIPFLRAKYAKLPQDQKPIALLIAAVLGILLMILLLKGCIAIVAKKAVPPEPSIIRQDHTIIIPKSSPLRAKMNVKTIRVSNSPHIVSVPGIVEADPSRTVNILPPFTGRLVALKIKLGDTVNRGQVLAVIRSPNLAQAHSDHDKAVALLNLTSEALKRARSVNRAGANSIKDIQLAKSNYTQALAERNRAAATLKAVGKNTFSLLSIKSPLDGRVTALNYGLGSYINDPYAPILTVSNTELIWVTANIPENMVGRVTKDLPVDVFLPAYPQQILHSKVSFVSAFLEPDTRRNNTRIAFHNPNGKLQPNMYATVKIALNEPDQVIVPISSILMNNDTTSVFVETTPWTFVRRDVELGLEDDKSVRVISGLTAGERVVTSGGVLMND